MFVAKKKGGENEKYSNREKLLYDRSHNNQANLRFCMLRLEAVA